MEQMTVKERFHASMNGKPVDRLPIMEWAGWWDKTVERWRSEGMPEIDRYEMYRYFGLDMYREMGCHAQSAETPRAASHGAGIISSEAEYEKIKPTLYRKFEMTPEYMRWIEENKRGENILRFGMQGFFWYPRQLFGIEKHLYAFYDHAELMHKINSDLTDWLCQTLETVINTCTPDFFTFAEDLSYNHGPMISEQQYIEFIMPYYKKILKRLAGLDTHLIVDSDGDITEPIAWFQKSGLTGALPLERQAGVDIDKIQEKYPGFKSIGHFDKTIMHRGEAALRKEFERVIPAAGKGGFIISVDHQTPPEVSIRDYQLYIRLFKEYAVFK